MLTSIGALAATGTFAAARLLSGELRRDVVNLAAMATASLSLHVSLALPEGSLETRSRRALALSLHLGALAWALALIVGSRLVDPGTLVGVWGIAELTLLPGLRLRYLGASALGRQRVQCLFVGIAFATMVALAVATLHELVRWPGATTTLYVASSGAVSVGLAVGALSRSARADRLLVHVIGTLFAEGLVASTFLVALRVLGHPPDDHASRVALGWALTATATSAVLLTGLRRRLGALATGFVYGAREAPDEVIRSFGSRLTRAVPMDELLLQLAESLRKTLELATAEVFTRSGETLERVASVPDVGRAVLALSGEEREVVARAGVSGNAWAGVWIPALLEGRGGGPLRLAPVAHGGELLGLIVVTRPTSAPAFREGDDTVLTELARQVGLALHNAQLDSALQSSLDELRRQADELRASRARIVATGDAERRGIERNLHDGAQQHLVALAVNLRLLRDVVTDDPAAATEMLEDLGQAVQETIREIRELAHGIYPPLLVDSGLSDALRAVAARSPLALTLEAEGLRRYGLDVEAAVYFCCLEALQNAAKHAASARVTARVWEESGSLLFEVADDGPGFDVRRAERGHGYTNMADRLGAIGGAVRWESAPGQGTRIRGSVPVGA